jgi:hypothetical protein
MLRLPFRALLIALVVWLALRDAGPDQPMVAPVMDSPSSCGPAPPAAQPKSDLAPQFRWMRIGMTFSEAQPFAESACIAGEIPEIPWLCDGLVLVFERPSCDSPYSAFALGTMRMTAVLRVYDNDRVSYVLPVEKASFPPRPWASVGELIVSVRSDCMKQPTDQPARSGPHRAR